MNSSVSEFQQNLYTYISMFDGNKKDFWNSEIQNKFNCVMHQSYNGIDALKFIHANLFALGSKAVSFNCQRMSADVFLVKFRLVNSKVDVTIEQLIYTQDGMIAQSSPGVNDAYLLHPQSDGTRTHSDTPVDRMSRPNILNTYKHKSEGQVKSRQIHHLRTYRQDWSSTSMFG